MSVDDLPPAPPAPRGGVAFLRRLSRLQLALVVVVVLVVVGGVVTAVVSSAGDESRTHRQARTPVAEEPGAPAPSTTAPGTRLPTEAAVRGNWPLIGNDEFDGPKLDTRRWGVYDGPSTNRTGTFAPANISVSDGELDIHGRGTSSAGMDWQHGQQYGRWEVRARSDAGTGFSPVLLLWPDAEDWPEGGEIDFMEIPHGTRDQNNVTDHYGADDSQDSTSQNGDFTQWHTFAVEWAPDHVSGFVDGEQVYRTTTRAAIPPRKMHLAIQQDPGPLDDFVPARDASTPPDVTLHVDWVRIYKL